MKTKVTLFITAAISAIFGAVIAVGISDSEAQAPPAGAKQIQFVITGEGEFELHSRGGGHVPVRRFEDPEYGIVCYLLKSNASCVKK